MMRGPPNYDDAYLSRKMGSLSLNSPLNYGRTPGYLQPWWYDYYPRSIQDYKPRSTVYYRKPTHRIYFPSPGTTREVWHLPTARSRFNYLKDWDVTSPHRPYLGYLPPPRLPPRPPPSYYDYGYGGGYDGGYGYGGGYPPYGYAQPQPYGGYYGGYAPPLPAPRPSRYDSLLDDDYEVSYPHLRSYRTALLTEAEKEKMAGELDNLPLLRSHSPVHTRVVTTRASSSVPCRVIKYQTRSTSPAPFSTCSKIYLMDTII